MLPLLLIVAVCVTYTDVRSRRIPNWLVLTTLGCGLVFNIFYGGAPGALYSVAGALIAFAFMFALYALGTTGAGDVKLFAAVGAVLGAGLVPAAFVCVLLTGLGLALFKMFRAGVARATAFNVLSFFHGLLPGRSVPRFRAPDDKRLGVPYGVAVACGSLAAAYFYHA
jgi:prepilin peptidase CpaA